LSAVARSGIYSTAELQETAVYDTERIVVRPVQQASEFIPLVHTAKLNPIADADRQSVGEIDVVRNQQGLAVTHIEDETLVP
jgi:hypothetical protein